MEVKNITSTIYECRKDELTASEQALVDMAIEATSRSYSKYSHFSVGAAVLLENGKTFRGCNQENAAFGVTICAERTALFTAGAEHPDVPVVAIAIAARTPDGQLMKSPVTPCGSCRQAMIETEQRSHRKLRILLTGADCIWAMDGICNLMPLSFTEDQM